MYDQEYSISRKSPGIFSFFELFTSNPIIITLFIIFPLIIGIISGTMGFIGGYILNFNSEINYFHIIRDTVIFYLVIGFGYIGCLIFSKNVPVLNFKISMLINIYCSGFFALSYFFGRYMGYLTQDQQWVGIFFILGGLLSYFTMFTILFSFTTVETPLNVLLALIQPVVGIILFSLFTENVNLNFFFNAIILFLGSAIISAIPYAVNMFSVSKIYRSRTGTGGYNFIRAFVASLLIDNQDDLIESYFDKIGVDSTVKMQYLAIRGEKEKNLKALFVTPDVHFGPFKTAGSAALTEAIYNRFPEIPGLSVFHTTTTHGENLTRHKYNSAIINIIEEDISTLDFKKIQIPEFHRFISGKAKVIGTLFDGLPLMIFSRHPFPSDDMMPKIGELISEESKQLGMKYSPQIIDAHNAIIGDEVLIKADTREGNEIIEVSKKFLKQMKQYNEKNELFKLEYGVAHDPTPEIPVNNGIGKGGITVHIFKVGRQLNAIIHFDGNNAILDVRPRITNLAENKGIDRVEVTTSDSHTVARILTAQGYYPIGKKVSINKILNKLDLLIDTAIENLEPVEIAIKESVTNGFRKWGDLNYFDVILETIEKSVKTSMQLLTIDLSIPILFSVLIAMFYLNVPIF